MNVIEVNNVIREFRIAERDTNFFRFLFCRKYKTKRAVNDISFKIKEGELVGFIGPNGAGKSTTIKMMSGILVPSAGVVKVLGMIPHEERKKVARQIYPALLDHKADDVKGGHNHGVDQRTKTRCGIGDAKQTVHTLGQQHLGSHLRQCQRVVLEHCPGGGYIGLEDHLLVHKEVQQGGDHSGGDTCCGGEGKAPQYTAEYPGQQRVACGIHHSADQ